MAQEPLSAFPLEPILRWPSEEARTWLHDFLCRLESDPRVCSVLAIGSAVGGGIPSADLDLVVLYGAEAPPLEILPIDVDVRAYSMSDVETLVEVARELSSSGEIIAELEVSTCFRTVPKDGR